MTNTNKHQQNDAAPAQYSDLVSDGGMDPRCKKEPCAPAPAGDLETAILAAFATTSVTSDRKFALTFHFESLAEMQACRRAVIAAQRGAR